MIDELRGRFALRLPHRFEDARLRNTAEIVVDSRPPTGGRHVEVDGARHRVGMSKAPRAAVPGFMNGIDAERSSVGEQRRLAVTVKCDEPLPEAVFVLGQLLRPLLMARLDRLGGGAVGE